MSALSQLVIVNIDELWLKGKNRPHYFRRLQNNVRSKLKHLHSDTVELKNENQRLICFSETPFSLETVGELQKVAGAKSIVPTQRLPRDEDALYEAVKKLLEFYPEKGKTFKVETHRVDKGFKKKSMDLSREVGAFILKNTDSWKVHMKAPELLVDIKVMEDHFYLSHQKYPAIGGLPVGSNGHLVTMISGGFDSPVASYMMAKRGCRQTFVFFHAYPFVGDEVKEKIFAICEHLAHYQNGCDLYVVPFGHLQKEIAKLCREDYRTSLFRRYMVESSWRLAQRIQGDALLTGDALGQVSSQTITNIRLIDEASRLPILRPLIGFNKQETIRIAQEIDTYEISVRPHDDACSLFAPKHPVIRPDFKYWNTFVAQNDFSEAMEKALDESEIWTYDPIGKRVRRQQK